MPWGFHGQATTDAIAGGELNAFDRLDEETEAAITRALVGVRNSPLTPFPLEFQDLIDECRAITQVPPEAQIATQRIHAWVGPSWHNQIDGQDSG